MHFNILTNLSFSAHTTTWVVMVTYYGCSDKCTCTYNGQSFSLVSLLLVGALSDPDVDSVPDVQNHHVITDQVLLGEIWDLVHREPPRGIGHLEQASWVVRFHFL